MSVVDFPNNPLVGDTFQFGNITYRWDGLKWRAILREANTDYGVTLQELLDYTENSLDTIFPSMFNIEGDGSDETLKIQEMFDASSGKTIILKENAIYGITSVSIPSDVTLVCRNAIFSKVTPSGSFGITINNRARVDNLVLTTDGGSGERGVLVQGSGCRIGRIAVISSSTDSGIGFQMSGAYTLVDNDIGELKVQNFSTSCYVVGCLRSRLSNVLIDTYVTGCYLVDIEDFQLNGLIAKNISPNATGGPGNNGLLIESAAANNSTNNCHFKRINIQDSGEHGVRVGGMLTVKNLFFSGVATKNTGAAGAVAGGGSGFKVLMNDQPGTYHKNIVVDNLVVEDCSTIGSGVGNFAAVVLGLCDGVTVNNVIVRKADNAYSCWDGLSIYECRNVNITNASITDTRRFPVRMEGGLGANVPNIQEDIKITGASLSCASGITEPVIKFDTRDTTFSRITIEADVKGGSHALFADNGTLLNPFKDCSVDLKYSNPESTAGQPPVVHDNVILVNYKGPWYGTFLMNGKDGSFVQDNDGNVRIRKNDIWVTL